MSNTRALTISVLHLCVQGLFVGCGTGANDPEVVDSNAPGQRDDDESTDSDETSDGDGASDASTSDPIDASTSTPDARAEGTDASNEPAIVHAFAPIDGPSNNDLVAAWVGADGTAY